MKTWFSSKKFWLWAGFGLLFILGTGIRLFHLYDQPLDFNSTRQLHSAVIARGMYYQNLASAPQWQRDMAVLRWQEEGLIEPPFMEAITALAYRLAGKEIVWAARLYSIFFWMAGSLALFLLLLEAAGEGGALVGLAYFLVLPFGAIASRAFQPDPLMVALIAFSLWAAVRWVKNPTWKNAVIAGLLGGLAIFIKTVAVFFVGGAWVGLVLSDRGLRKAIADRQVWLIAFLSIVPFGIFYIYGMYINGQLASQFSLRFFPNLWVDPVFYLQWVGQIGGTASFEWFLMALVSIFLVRERNLRWMLDRKSVV
jgi:4-amino-4-deoxy-L-arabinose transferase-like glycosyltransferase